jgi:ubiquitin carboxyl-terminal hydrolase 44/49
MTVFSLIFLIFLWFVLRWSGRNHREKIGVHVGFEEILNMEPYCYKETLKSLRPECFIYDLSAVVMHHGKGFGSGHYTAYCYNSEGGINSITT